MKSTVGLKEMMKGRRNEGRALIAAAGKVLLLLVMCSTAGFAGEYETAYRSRKQKSSKEKHVLGKAMQRDLAAGGRKSSDRYARALDPPVF